jgi:hypothetical protein
VQAATSTSDGATRDRMTRALALHLAARSDTPWPVAEIRLLNPADRRLAADAVKARRGRVSPSSEHDAVFRQQAWYRVDPGYTDNVLDAVELENIAMANDPPDRAPEPAAEPTLEMARPAPVAQPPSACGCASAPHPAMSWSVAALLTALRRSRPR